MPDTQAIDSTIADFKDGVQARTQQARAAQLKYEPIGEGFTLSQSDAPMSVPVRMRYEPLADPISLSEGQPQQPAKDDTSFLSDIGKGVTGSAINAVGSGVRQAGKLLQGSSYLGAGITADSNMIMKDNPLDSAADWIQGKGKAVSGDTSPLYQLAKENSTPDGNLTDPSTWTLGKDPSLRGYMAQGADVLGSMAPILLSGFLGKAADMAVAATAGVSGLVGGGAAIDQARQTIANMDDDTLQTESKVYRDALAQGKSPDEARKLTSDAAENWASVMTAPVSVAGGALLGKALSPAGRVFGSGGVAKQTVGGTLSAGSVEGGQEALENVATNLGVNQGAGTSIDPMEGSFGNAVLGFMGGAGPGAVHGARQGVATRSLPVADSIQPSDITHNGKPFITLPAALKAAEQAGGGAQVHRVGNRFIVRKAQDAGSEFIQNLSPRDGAEDAASTQDALPDTQAQLDQRMGPPSKREAAQARADAEINGERPAQDSSSTPSQSEFEPGQQVFINQNGNSMPVEFVGYENNAATANSGARLARIKTPDGRGRFVHASDLVAEQPTEQPQGQAALEGPASREALGAPPSRAALPAPDNVTAAGDGFVTRPAFNIPENAPRGIRNNNPGNIEKGVGFQGEVQGNDSRFATFDSPESGIRGLARNLLTYQNRYGLNTVDAIINRWAPGNENNTGAYVSAVARAMGVAANDSLDLHNPDTLEKLTTAIIQHENGMQPYGPEHIRAGVGSALTGAPLPRALPAPTVTVNSEGQAATADQRTASNSQARAQADDAANMGLTPDVVKAAANHPATLEAAMHEAQTSPKNNLPEPTDAQKEAGNYKMGHVTVDGLDISIENPEGSVRSGTDEDGNTWSNTLRSHYGYVRGTKGADGDHLDTFIKPGVVPQADGRIYVIDQINPKTGKFDETKTMLGYGSQKEAEAAYKANYEPGWKGMGSVTAWDMPTFKAWIKDGDTTKPSADYQHQAQDDSGLGSIASESGRPNGKGYVMRSEAQKQADSVGGHVVKAGDRFVVRNEIAGQDVTPPGADRRAGPTANVVTPAGREVKIRYRVVDAGNLITSNTDTGAANPNYPAALQPRNRSRGASDIQINDIAQNIRPQLLGMSATTSDGAPIISHKGVVESGNGRTLAIQRAYSQKLESAKKYKQWLKDQGYDISGMKAPVLVRQRETAMTDAEMRAYTRESNERTTAQMSATEQAQADAKSIAPILGDFVGGDIGSAANRDFVRKFARDVVSKTDQGGMFSSDGVLSQEGRRRIEGALLSAAYDSPELVADLLENTDSDIKAISGALLDVAGPWAQMRADAKSGGIPADMDLTANLIGAVNLVRRARADGRSINDLANQADLISGEVDPATKDFLRLLFSGDQYNRARGRNPVAQDLAAYVSIAQSTVPGDNMFGESPPSGQQTLRTINDRRQNAERTGDQQDLFTGTAGTTSSDEAGRGQARRQGNAELREPTATRSERSDNAQRDQVNEPSRDGQTIDMFSGQGEAQGNLDLPSRAGQGIHSGRRSAPPIPSFPTAASRARAVVIGREDANGKSAVIVERKQTGTIAVGVDQVNTSAEAAHALASIRKSPQENVVALITDKDGRPISVFRHTVGKISQADVLPGILAGHVARTKNAANVWLAHNHPSGIAEFSSSDIRMTDMYRDLTSGGRVQLRGMLAIAGSKHAFYDPSDQSSRRENVPTQAIARTRSVPIVERIFRRVGSLDASSLNPTAAPALVKRLLNGEPGIVFLDSQHRPVATVPMILDEMAKLKGTGGVDKVLAGIERANASNAMVYVPEGATIYARNVATLIEKSGTRVLDLIVGQDSQAAQGRDLTNPRGAVESRGKPTAHKPGGFAAELQGMADDVMSKLPGAGNLDVRVVNRASQVPENYKPSINAEGVYYPEKGAGRVYLVADNLPSVERARQVLAHEIVGHYGMEALLGARFADVLADIERLTAIPSGVKIGIQRPGDTHYATLDAVKMDYPDYSPENQAREVLARMAETGVRPYFMERVYGYIRKFLRSLGLAGKYSAAEIKNMVVDAAARLRNTTPDQSRAGVLSAAESLRQAESRRQARPVDLPNAVIGTTLGSAGKHPDYVAAKAGDTPAAIRLVRDLVTPDVLDKVRKAIGNQDVTIVPVAAIESTGHNRIPPVVAAKLAESLGLPVDNGSLYQSVKAKRSALGGLDRIFQQSEFEGPVTKGMSYFLVDDTLTQGGTFAALAQHIQSNGGRVVGSFALTGKQYSATLRLSPETLNQVRERYGDLENQFREATGRGFDSLTESEGRYLASHGTPDTVRNRIIAERNARRDSASPQSIPNNVNPDSARDSQTPPSEGFSDSEPMESRATTAGPMPSGKPAQEPRYRGNVERPGESLSSVERKLRERAMSKIGAFSEVEPIKDRAKKLTDNWQAKAIQGVFDQFAPLKSLDIKAYMQARLSKGTDGAVEAVFTHGKVKLNNGALDVDSSGGLADVLAQLRGEHDHFFAWIAGNRAARLKAEGRENLFTEKDIETLQGLNRGDKSFPDRDDVYTKALKEFNDLQKSVMDVAQEAGLINGESRNLWEHEFYVPFYRVMEEDQTGTMGPGQIGGLVGQRAFKKLKGGQEKLGDLLGNTLSNWSHLLSASMKNLAAQQALEAAQKVGIAEKVSTAEKGSVRVMADGKEVHYLVDEPLVFDALTALNYVGSNTPVMKAMRTFKHYLTTGVTLSPTFRIRNLARDVISAMATTDVSYNPVKNLADGWRGTSADSPTMRKLLAGGGAVRFGSLNDGDQANNAKRLIDMGVESGQILDSQAKVKHAFRGAWEWYKELGDRGETINRAAIYEKAIKDGRSHLEASYMARDLMDFTAGGKFASIRLLTQVVPFFNARLQGMYKLGRAAKDDPRRFAIVTGAVALASSLLYLAGRDDDEYKELPDWVRNTYWVTRMPGTGKFVYIPKPFEVGALGTIVERMTELAVAGDDYRAKDFGKTVLHVMSDQLAMNPIPQLFKPAMGAAFNYDDFRGVDIDSQAQMRLPAGDRSTARTSAGAVAVGKALGISPQRLEFMLRGYFGWLGTQALNVADIAVRPLLGLPDNPMRDVSRVDNWFIAGDFIKESEVRSSKYVQRFYDQQRDIEQIYAAFSEARKTGDIERAMELAGRDEIKLRPLFQAANKQMKAINSQIKQIDNDADMDAKTKTQLRDMLYQKRNRIAMLADEKARAR